MTQTMVRLIAPLAVSRSWASFLGVLMSRAPLFGVYIGARHFWKLYHILYIPLGPLVFGNSAIPRTVYPDTIYSISHIIYPFGAPHFRDLRSV